MTHRLMMKGKHQHIQDQVQAGELSRLIKEIRWLRAVPLMSHLLQEGIFEESIGCINADPDGSVEGFLQDLQATVQFAHHSVAEDMNDLALVGVHSKDGQMLYQYEYPYNAALISSSESFCVEAAERANFSPSVESNRLYCIENPETVLLRITGDCTLVASERGDVKPVGHSLGDKSGFFLAALKEGEAIRVTTHDHTEAMVYLYMDDVVSELSVSQWQDHFAPFLAPLE